MSMRIKVTPNRVLLACFNDFRAEISAFSHMVADFVGVDVTGRKIFYSNFPPEAECPKSYREKENIEISPTYEENLHRFYRKWTMVLIEDFGIDCGWRRVLNC